MTEEQVKVPKEKWELQITDTIKIQQYDDKNFVILQLKEGYNPFAKETVISYKEQGYFSTLFKALDAILTKDLLIDINEISSVKQYVNEVRGAKAYIKELVEGL